MGGGGGEGGTGEREDEGDVLAGVRPEMGPGGGGAAQRSACGAWGAAVPVALGTMEVGVWLWIRICFRLSVQHGTYAKGPGPQETPLDRDL